MTHMYCNSPGKHSLVFDVFRGCVVLLSTAFPTFADADCTVDMVLLALALCVVLRLLVASTPRPSTVTEGLTQWWQTNSSFCWWQLPHTVQYTVNICQDSRFQTNWARIRFCNQLKEQKEHNEHLAVRNLTISFCDAVTQTFRPEAGSQKA